MTDNYGGEINIYFTHSLTIALYAGLY